VNRGKINDLMIIFFPNIERGGFQKIDIKSYFIALKATWVSRLVTGHISNWKLIPLKYFNAIGKNWFYLVSHSI
jgi:hypothetical protein